MIHELKSIPPFYQEVERGMKSFEVRKNDRNFQVGDKLYLREWIPAGSAYTGREKVVTIVYILHGGKFGIDTEYVVMGIQ